MYADGDAALLLLLKEEYSAGRVAQMVEGVPSKCEALSSNPVSQKNKKNIQ
jgi:hypothetical protein